MTKDGADRWWSQRRIADGGLVYRVGPLTLYLQRLEGEWQVAHEQDPEKDGPANGWSVEATASIPPGLDTVQRYASGAGEETVRVRPRPADRSVVARPRAALNVLPGGEARFYVSAPVWLEIAVGEPPRPLCLLPSKRLSDTWFGSSTRDGEVAYALKTQARTRLEDVPQLAYRAVTPVVISNRGSDLLQLERMNLPVPYLSIYSSRSGQLWTEAVTLARHEDNEMASFEVGQGPPAEASDARQVGEPRLAAADSPLVRAFGKLLRPFSEDN